MFVVIIHPTVQQEYDEGITTGRRGRKVIVNKDSDNSHKSS